MCVSWEANLGPLQQQKGLLPAELSPQHMALLRKANPLSPVSDMSTRTWLWGPPREHDQHTGGHTLKGN